MTKSPNALLKDINGGKFRPIYYFFGSEDYRITEAIKYLSHKFLPDLQFTTNFRKLDGKKTKTADLLNELAAIPMLGEKQVFVITDFQSFKPKEIQKILSILSPPDPNRIVILSSPSVRTPDKRSAFLKTMDAEAEVVQFNRLTKTETGSTIQKILHKEEIAIAPDALNLLTDLLAGNRGAIESELAKLVNYKNKGESVTLEDVKKLTNGFEVFTVFELADYVVSGETTKVVKMLRSLLAEGNSPITLTMLLQQHFSSLYLAKNNKKPIGNRQFLVGRFKQQASKYTNERLEQIIIEIAEADAQLRRQAMDKEMTLEVLALKLTGEHRK